MKGRGLGTPAIVLALLAGCGGADLDTAGTGDSGAGAAVDEIAFDAAVLDPPFSHANAIWAGVALLDFDGDGWTDIFFTNGAPHPDALYRNNGDGSFTDVAADAGVASVGQSGAVVAGDLDNDGDPDLVVSEECSTGSRAEDGDALLDGAKHVWLNQGDGRFVERSLAPLDPPAGSSTEVDPKQRCTASMTLADVDSDGILDLILSNNVDPDLAPPWSFDKFHSGVEDIVLYGDGTGDFTRTSHDLGLWGSFVSIARDLDGDGRVDLLVGTAGRDLAVWLQAADGSFVQDTDAGRVGRGLWMGLALADFDGDLDLDLYGTNQGPSVYMQGYDNTAPWDPGEVQPRLDPLAPEASATLERTGVNPFHSLMRADGGSWRVDETWTVDQDALLAGDLFGGMADGAHADLVPLHDLQRYAWGWGAAALDADADGWTDVAWTGNNCSAPMDIIWTEDAGAGPGALLRNRDGQGFEDWTAPAGVANLDAQGRYADGRGIAVGDLNNDGYADLVIANRTYNPSQTSALAQEPGVPRVWLSRPRAGHWLGVRLVGGRSNRDAVGATVQVTAGGRTTVHAYGAGGTTSSSSARELLVGLSDAPSAELEVVFPAGTTLDVGTVDADQWVTVEEP